MTPRDLLTLIEIAGLLAFVFLLFVKWLGREHEHGMPFAGALCSVLVTLGLVASCHHF